MFEAPALCRMMHKIDLEVSWPEAVYNEMLDELDSEWDESDCVPLTIICGDIWKRDRLNVTLQSRYSRWKSLVCGPGSMYMSIVRFEDYFP